MAGWVLASSVVNRASQVFGQHESSWLLHSTGATTGSSEQLDQAYMKKAIEAARHQPKAPFGAVLVNHETNVVVAEGFNRAVDNPTWHGEMVAINKCASLNPRVDWSRLTLYTTAEPCAMCQGAVAWSGIPRVVFGSSIPFLKSLDWWAIDIRAEEVARLSRFRKCTVTGGVLENECNELFKAALRR
jgi:tRNA(Arg) A34 adenosine deaminase TadA